ncbi:hypothetical protein GKZ90_0022775 [Flavobacterium sp. MC2016-06]
MKKKFFFLLVFFCMFKSFAQDNSQDKPNYDELLKLEGIEYVGGITFCIEKKNQNLIAIQNGIIKWKAEVVTKCSKRKTKIKFISVRSGKLKVTFGKENVALVNIENGEIECLINKKEVKIKKEMITFPTNDF